MQALCGLFQCRTLVPATHIDDTLLEDFAVKKNKNERLPGVPYLEIGSGEQRYYSNQYRVIKISSYILFGPSLSRHDRKSIFILQLAREQMHLCIPIEVSYL